MMVLWHVMAYIARAHLLAEIHMMVHSEHIQILGNYGSEQNMMAEGHKQQKEMLAAVTFTM